VREMSDDGVHKKNAGERKGRSLANHQNKNNPKIGFRGIVHRARLSNAMGYDAKDAPRIPRGISIDSKYGISFSNKFR